MNRPLFRASVSLSLLLGSMFACSDEDVAPGTIVRSDAAPVPTNPGPPPTLPDGAPNPEYDGGTIGVSDFDITVIADGTLVQGKPFEVAVKVNRKGYNGAITVKADSLPTAVGSADVVDIAPGSSETVLKLSGDPTGAQGPGKVKLSAKSADGKIAKTTEFNLYVKGAPGTLDKTFGTNGYAVIPAGLVGVNTGIVSQDSTGRIYVARHNGLPRPVAGGGGTLARFSADGILDGTYGNAGITPFSTVNNFRIPALMVDSDGTVYAGNVNSTLGTRGGIEVTRYAPNGQLDAAFSKKFLSFVPPTQFCRFGSGTFDNVVSLDASTAGITASIFSVNQASCLGTAIGDGANLHGIGRTQDQTFPTPATQIGTRVSFSDNAGRFYSVRGGGNNNLSIERFATVSSAATSYIDPTGWPTTGSAIAHAFSASGKLALWETDNQSATLLIMKPDFSGPDAGYPRAFMSETTSNKDMTFDSSEFIVTLTWVDGTTFTIKREAAGVPDASFTPVLLAGSSGGGGKVLAQADRKIVFATTNSAGTAVQLGRLWN
jgi:hypothetical protein